MRKLEDAYLHKGLRKQLVDLLRTKGITDEQVLEAIGSIPRHFFLDSAFDRIAYEDRAFPIAADQTISQPYTVAYQTQLLQIKPGEKVLEIGTGSMYQTTVLAAMGAKVFTIERQKQLFDLTPFYVFKQQYPDIYFSFGDGFEGLPTYAPYDRIIVTCGAAEFPSQLLDQLKPGGAMVIPYGVENDYVMTKVEKDFKGKVATKSFDSFKFVPMIRSKSNL